METRSRTGNGEYPDVIRKKGVEIVTDIRGGKIRVKAELGDLPFCVHAGIRPSRAVDFRPFAGHALQDRLQLALDRVVGVSLLLPAVVPGAVVLDDHAIIVHCCHLLIYKRQFF